MTKKEIVAGLQKILHLHTYELSREERTVLREAIEALEYKALQAAIEATNQESSPRDLTPARWHDLDGTVDF